MKGQPSAHDFALGATEHHEVNGARMRLSYRQGLYVLQGYDASGHKLYSEHRSLATIRTIARKAQTAQGVLAEDHSFDALAR